MKQIEIFRAFSYESLKDLVNNWLQQNNYTIIDTSMSIYATHLNVIFCMSVLYEIPQEWYYESSEDI